MGARRLASHLLSRASSFQEVVIVAADKKVLLKFVRGPNKFKMMLAVFDGQLINLKFVANRALLLAVNTLLKERRWSFPVWNINFLDRAAGPLRHVCEFDTAFPISSEGGHFNVKCHIDLETREGWLDVTAFCESGLLPWPVELGI